MKSPIFISSPKELTQDTNYLPIIKNPENYFFSDELLLSAISQLSLIDKFLAPIIPLFIILFDKLKELLKILNTYTSHTRENTLSLFFNHHIFFHLPLFDTSIDAKLREFQIAHFEYSFLHKSQSHLFVFQSRLTSVSSSDICRMNSNLFSYLKILIPRFNNATKIKDHKKLSYLTSFLLFEFNYTSDIDFLVDFILSKPIEFKLQVFNYITIYLPTLSNDFDTSLDRISISKIKADPAFRLLFKDPDFQVLCFNNQSTELFEYCDFEKLIKTNPETFF